MACFVAMSTHRLLRTTALALGGFLAVAALQGCGKSDNAANGQSGGDQTASDAGGPNGYAPTGEPIQAPQASGGPSGAHHDHAYAHSAGYYVDQAPPPIPQYDQPPPPGDGYYWTPGYWGWSEADSDYYWVPGTWVEPPNPGLYWTPGYWAYVDGGYSYYDGYWGPVVGYYGGVDYGWGYNGRGYFGGRWGNGRFAYNSAANNLGSIHVTNVYREDTTNWTNNRTSYSGGPHGLRVAPTPQQVSAVQAPHVAPTAGQRQQVSMAKSNPQLRASANRGAPPVVATARPGAFQGPGVVTEVKGQSHYNPPAHIQSAAQPPAAAHAAAVAPQAQHVAPAAAVETRTAPPAQAARPVTEARPAPEVRSAPIPKAEPVRPAPAARPEVMRAAPPPQRAEVHAAPAPEARMAPPPQARAAPPARAAPAPARPEERRPESR